MGDQQQVEKKAAERRLETLPPTDKVSHWCVTENEVIKVDFEWTIQQLTFLESFENFGSFYSSYFVNEKANNVPKWRLHLNGTGSEIKIQLEASQLQQIGYNYFVKVKMAISNQKREKIFPQQHSLPQYTKLLYVVYQIKKDILFGSECLVNGKLTIYCEVEQCNTNMHAKDQVKAEECQQEKRFSDQLADQLEELFKNMKFSDFTINVRGREFQAHKSILASRSTVFSAMFDHPTKENLTNRVEIKDVDPDVFYEILRYIYTGRMSEATMEKMLAEIFAVADKYLLDQLKMECETQLIHRMTAESCLSLLLVTDEHHPAFNLRKYAVEFFRRFSGEVMTTDGWENAKKDFSELCFSLLEELVKSFV